jgi:hypothetical protein
VSRDLVPLRQQEDPDLPVDTRVEQEEQPATRAQAVLEIRPEAVYR